MRLVFSVSFQLHHVTVLLKLFATNIKHNMLHYVSYMSTIICMRILCRYQIKLITLKLVLVFGVKFVYGCAVDILMFQYGIEMGVLGGYIGMCN